MEKPWKFLRSPFEMFILLVLSVVIVTVLSGYIILSTEGATWGLFIGLMIGVPLGSAAGFWQAIKNGKTISRMKNQHYYTIQKKRKRI
jgi:uncharacterized membrane protein YdjX (TVP38/TMEM64 family)